MNQDEINYCGWDIGGAHLKFAGVSAGGSLIAVKQLKCPLWLGVDNLIHAVRQIKREYSLHQAEHAITMTGELCDNFKDRDTGVSEIINGISGELESRSSFFYGVDDQWYKVGEDLPWQKLASANWHASARFVGRYISNAIIVDFGSTTVDVIPVANGEVVSRGHDDFSRLKFRELVYTGMVRTPVSAIVRQLPYGKEMIPVAAESFSNAADIYRILKALPDSADLYPSMDGGGKTRVDSARRLFRMIGRDFAGEVELAESMARYVSETQLDLLREALHDVSRYVTANYGIEGELPLVGLGCGAKLVKKLAGMISVGYRNFDELFEPVVRRDTDSLASFCAPAAAVAAELRIMRTS